MPNVYLCQQRAGSWRASLSMCEPGRHGARGAALEGKLDGCTLTGLAHTLTGRLNAHVWSSVSLCEARLGGVLESCVRAGDSVL